MCGRHLWQHARRARQSGAVFLPDTRQLRQDFNDEQAELGVLSVVSPTCDRCLSGLQLVLDTIAPHCGCHGLRVYGSRCSPAIHRRWPVPRAEGVRVDASVGQYLGKEGWLVSARLRSCWASVRTIRRRAHGMSTCCTGAVPSGTKMLNLRRRRGPITSWMPSVPVVRTDPRVVQRWLHDWIGN